MGVGYFAVLPAELRHGWYVGLIGTTLLLAGCRSAEPTLLSEPASSATVIRPTAEVVVTVFASYVIGELRMVGDCLTVVDEVQTSYTLVWPPDVSAEINGDAVTITTGLVSGNVKTAQLRLGDQAYIGGGEVSILDDQLKTSIPEGCPSPYWVSGGRIEPALEVVH